MIYLNFMNDDCSFSVRVESIQISIRGFRYTRLPIFYETYLPEVKPVHVNGDL